MTNDKARGPDDKNDTTVRGRVMCLIPPESLFVDDSGAAYLDINLGEGPNCRQEVHLLHSQQCRLIITRLYIEEYGAPPTAAGLKDGIAALDAIAQGIVHRVGLRTVKYGSGFAVDLGDRAWSRLVIEPKGWEILPCGPRLIRAEGCLPLPHPQGTCDLRRTLSRFVNVQSEEDLDLVIGWLVHALRPHGPYPPLVLQGEQSSSKTTVARILVSLADPNAIPLLTMPDTVRSAMVIAKSRHVLAIDNISSLDEKLKDAFCRIATGAGYLDRRLYTDSESVAWQVCRPVILNSISNLLLADDLADRALAITLPPIPQSQRRPERVFWEEFEADRPSIFGGLVAAAVHALAHPASVVGLPRMADFAQFAMSAAPSWGCPSDQWLAAYESNRFNATAIGLDGDPVAYRLRARPWPANPWLVTTGELYADLAGSERDALMKVANWPRSPRALGDALRRLTPALRSVGISVEYLGHMRDGNRWCLTREKGDSP